MQTKSWFLVPLRRSFAALINMTVVGLIAIEVLNLFNKDFEHFNWYLVIGVFMAMWVVWDYLLTAIFKTTLGHWICGVKLSRPDGGRVSFLQTIKSVVAFWGLGIVFGVPYLQIVGLIGNYLYYLKTGTFLWDNLAGIQPHYKWTKPRSVIGTILVLFLGLGIFSNYYGIKPEINCYHDRFLLIHGHGDCQQKFNLWW